MMIFMLAIAMALTMLIATAVALVNEADKLRVQTETVQKRTFRPGRLS